VVIETGEPWKPFTSTQRIIAQGTAIDWEARIGCGYGDTDRHDFGIMIHISFGTLIDVPRNPTYRL
jgi:hypothetical protein